jgi:hypothetical protein
MLLFRIYLADFTGSLSYFNLKTMQNTKQDKIVMRNHSRFITVESIFIRMSFEAEYLVLLWKLHF